MPQNNISSISRFIGKQTSNNHDDHDLLYYYICGKLLQYRCSRPHKRNSYYVCGDVCSRQQLLRFWKMYYICGFMYYICGFITLNAADFCYVCGLLRLRTLLHWRAFGGGGWWHLRYSAQGHQMGLIWACSHINIISVFHYSSNVCICRICHRHICCFSIQGLHPSEDAFNG